MDVLFVGGTKSPISPVNVNKIMITILSPASTRSCAKPGIQQSR